MAVDTIDRTVAKTYSWLGRLESIGAVPNQSRAYLGLRAVLQALRDRVGPEVAAHLSAQLPLLVRGVFYEGWDPTHTPVKHTRAEFLERIQREAYLQDPSEAEEVARAVFALLWDELGDGTMSKVMSVLPRDYANLL
ncbi:MAG TPA: DUF2267 domain-containing protein [Acidimicrobiales bacterium]